MSNEQSGFRRITHAATFLSVSLLALVGGSSADAVGFGFEYQSAMASARGNALTAGYGGSEMLHYNPAALVLAEHPETSLNLIFPKGEISVRQGGTRYETDDDWLLAGSFFYTHPFEIADKTHALGFGLRAPYGQSASWQQGVPFAPFGREAEMEHLEALFGGAFDLGNGFSLGGNIVFADSELEIVSDGVFLPTDTQTFDGDDTSLAFQLAFHHQWTSRFSWGVNYRSGYSLGYKGNLDYKSGFGIGDARLPAKFDLDFPDHLTIGAAYQINDFWVLALQSQWTRWSEVGSFSLSTPAGNNTQPVNWQNGWIHSIGSTWSIHPSVDLHAGYMFTESIIEEPFNTPLNGDFDQHFLSAGVSWKVETWQVDLAIIRLLSEDRTITNSAYGFAGEHESSGWFVNAGLRKSF